MDEANGRADVFSSHTVRAFEVLQSLRNDEDLCDIKLVADDGSVVCGHKAVLASVSPYFRTMFTSHFVESNKERVNMREMDSNALRLSVDFIYTSQISVTEHNVHVLLHTANLLQLQRVQHMCCDFLLTQLQPTNCLGLMSLANVHGFTKLSAISEVYAREHFSEVVRGDEFLTLSFEQVVELISSDELTIDSEEIVFDSVICWVNHDLIGRKDFFPKLREHVRLPLLSKEYLLRVIDIPLIKNNQECKYDINEALHLLLFKPVQNGHIRKKKCTKPRKPVCLNFISGILVVGGRNSKALCSTEWHDPVLDDWEIGPNMKTPRTGAGLTVLKDHRVFLLGGFNGSKLISSVEVLDLSLQYLCWLPTVSMLSKRAHLGAAVIKNCIYAVGGFDGNGSLDSAEVFDSLTHQWRMISSMSIRRRWLGVGVINSLLYAVGGYDEVSDKHLKSVECYDPSTDSWTHVAEMNVGRSGVSVGVLNGDLFAVGGENEDGITNTVEIYRPYSGTWRTVGSMNKPRKNAGVAAVCGLLYVVGGVSYNDRNSLDCMEYFNPISEKWYLTSPSMNFGRISAGVVCIDKPPNFRT